MTVIEAHQLTKRYGDTEAVRGVSFEIAAGEVFCLLGPNGAGKTTTVEIVEGHRLPSSGAVSVLGHDPGKGERALRDRIGVVLQEESISQDLTVGELLEMQARWYSRSLPVDDLIALVELDASRNTRAGTLSGGQRRRLDLALGLVGDPDVLFLDEPTTGFDPHARRQAWSTIRSLCDLGKTVVLTTHYMEEAQVLADRVAVMVAGEIVAIGPPESLGGRDERPTEIRFALPAGIAVGDLPSLPAATISEQEDGVLITTTEGVSAIHELSGWALQHELPLPGLSLSQPSLEDIYLALTSDEREEALR
jgi:ABC-2 type transport system ATP-binding protein